MAYMRMYVCMYVCMYGGTQSNSMVGRNFVIDAKLK